MTEIETWLRDPYAIHARHVLRLNSLRPLDEATPLPGTAYKVEIATALVARALASIET